VANFYGELVIRITSDTSGLKKGLGESAAGVETLGKKAATTGRLTAARMEHVGRQMQNVGRQMTQFVTLPVVAGFALAGIAAFKFEDSLMKIQNLTGTTAAQTKAWGDELLKLGAATGQTPLKLAESLYFVASSGFKGAEAMAIINVSAKAAAAGLGDVKVTADVLTSAMNAYGKKTYTAAQVTDFLMKTIEVGKAEPVALATSLGRIMPVAANLKVGLDELGGNVAALTLGGLSSAEAVTALRGTMMSLVAPAKMSIDQLATMGLSYRDLTDSIANKGLLPTLKMLWEGTDRNMLSMRKIIPNVRALNGVLSLLGANYKSNLEVIDKVSHAQGTLDRAMKNTAEQPIQKLRKAWASLQGSFIKIGAVLLPYFARLATSIAKVAESFTKMSPGWRDFLLRAAATAAVIGPVVMVLGTLVNAIGLLRGSMAGLSVVKGISAAFSAVGTGGATAAVTAFGAALSPVAIALGAIAVAAAGIYGITKLSDWLDGTTARIGAMRTAAQETAADTSLQKWADKMFGGHLVAVGKNDFQFTPPKIEAGTEVLADWQRTVDAKARAARVEGQAQARVDLAKGQKAYLEQQIHELQNMPTPTRGFNLEGVARAKAARDAQVASIRAQILGVEGIGKRAQAALDKLKIKDQAIVFKARIAQFQSEIGKVKARIKELAGKPHTITTILATQKSKERLADLRAGLKSTAGKSYQVRIQARIEALQGKVDLAKRALEAIPKGKHSAKVTADITKLTDFVKTGERKLKTLAAKVTKPIIDADAGPALSAIQNVTTQLNALATRGPTIVKIQVQKSILPVGTDAYGGYYRKPRLTIVGDDGPEVVLPMNKPRRVAQLARQSGLDRMLAPARGISGRPNLARAASTGGYSGPAEVHYHSHVSVPAGIVVDDTERFARRLAPWQERELETAQRRRQRGQATL